MSAPLASDYRGIPPNRQTVFTAEEQQRATDEINGLFSGCPDRVVGDIPLIAVRVDVVRVQIVLSVSSSALLQAIGRIKSKVASSLLRHSDRKDAARIWGRGFWYARLLDEEATQQVLGFMHGKFT
jgi:hypothetical protein